MKKEIKITCVLLMLLIINFTQAQNVCEFNNVYSTQNGPDEIGSKIVKGSNQNLFAISFDGFSRNSLEPINLSIALTMLDNCGIVIWKKNLDSIESKNILGIDLINRINGNLLLSTYNFENHDIPGLHFYNINQNGILLWHKKIKDSVNYYNLNKMIEINLNSYLIAGSKNQKASFIIIDSLANIINQQSFSIDSLKNSTIQNAYILPNKNILLLGLEANTPFIITIDTLGNLLNKKIIASIQNFNNYYINFNYDNTSIIINGSDSSNTKNFVNYYTLDGLLIKSFLSENYGVLNKGAIFTSYGSNVNIIYCDSFWIKVDSNINIISTYYLNRQFYNSQIKYSMNSGIKIADNEIAGIGGILIHGLGISSWSHKMEIKKIGIINQINFINIIGQNSINQKNSTLQLTANISPTNANNKNLLWSISDTNLATITQKGLLTAKANGTVIVTATAADGGGAKATKAITISNQNVGKNEVNLNNQITVYPNPASNTLTINQINANFSYKIINLQGQEILNGELKKPFSSIDISKLEAGSYIIGLTTETGIFWKKFVKN